MAWSVSRPRTDVGTKRAMEDEVVLWRPSGGGPAFAAVLADGHGSVRLPACDAFGGRAAAAAAARSAADALREVVWTEAAPEALVRHALPAVFDAAQHECLRTVLDPGLGGDAFFRLPASVERRPLRDYRGVGAYYRVEDNQLLGVCDAGTTLTVLAGLRDGSALVSHAGDSAVVRFRAGEDPLRLTADHSTASASERARVASSSRGALAATGRYFTCTLPELNLHRRIMPSRSLGHPLLCQLGGITHRPYSILVPCLPGDVCVAATDGLWDEMGARAGDSFLRAMAAAVLRPREPAEALADAVAAVLGARAKGDNCAFVVARWQAFA
jgi:serine/threonine protein phosphatase PrpC